MSFQPFLGFAPDADYDTPGALPDCQHMVPTPRGMRVQPGWALGPDNAGRTVPAAEPVQAIASLRGASGVYRFCRTNYRIYKSLGDGPWQDVSPSPVHSPNGPSTFASLGNYVITAGGASESPGANAIFAADMNSGVFAPMSSAPRASIVVSANRFVLAFGDYDYADRWSCSARDDHTSWTANLSTLAATGRIVDRSGGFTAAIEFSGDVLAFKRNSVHIGRFVGAPEVWEWTALPYNVGCISSNAVCHVPGGVLFVSDGGPCMFDGATVRPLLEGRARQWWTRNFDAAFGRFMYAAYDEVANQAWVSHSTFNKASSQVHGILAIDLPSGRLGLARYGCDAFASCHDHSKGGVQRIYGALRPGPSLGNRIYSRFDLSGEIGASWFDSADFTYARDPAEQTPYFVMPELGDGMSEVELTELRLKWREAPDDATAVHYTRPYAGGPLSVVGESPLSDTKSFQTRANARWHRVKVRLRDNAEMTGYQFEPTPTGRKGAR